MELEFCGFLLFKNLNTFELRKWFIFPRKEVLIYDNDCPNLFNNAELYTKLELLKFYIEIFKK